MTVFHTDGEPPSRGSTMRPYIGWIANMSAADTNTVSEYNRSIEVSQNSRGAGVVRAIQQKIGVTPASLNARSPDVLARGNGARGRGFLTRGVGGGPQPGRRGAAWRAAPRGPASACGRCGSA